MSVQVENLEKNMAKLTIEVAAGESVKCSIPETEKEYQHPGIPQGQSSESNGRENVRPGSIL